MQVSFDLDHEGEMPEIFTLAEGEVHFHPRFLKSANADSCYQELKASTPWQQDSLRFGGKSVLVPRLQAWYGDRKSHYGYSGLALSPLPWTPLLLSLRKNIENVCKQRFNSVLLNYYRDGNDSVAWHSDDEKELGDDPVIASLSLGGTRRFELKHRHNNSSKVICDLSHGSLLVMGKGIQHNWQHQVPKQPGINSGRINLTFRFIFH